MRQPASSALRETTSGGIGDPLTARKGIEGRESRSAGYNVRCQELNTRSQSGSLGSKKRTCASSTFKQCFNRMATVTSRRTPKAQEVTCDAYNDDPKRVGRVFD